MKCEKMVIIFKDHTKDFWRKIAWINFYSAAYFFNTGES